MRPPITVPQNNLNQSPTFIVLNKDTMKEKIQEVETMLTRAHEQCCGDVNLINVLTAQTLIARALEIIRELDENLIA